MGYENHFVKKETISFKVKDLEFEYKKKTCGDEASWVPHCMTDVPDGRVLNPGLINLWKCTNLVSVPWKPGDIKFAIGVEKEWKELSDFQKVDVIKALNPKFGSEIMIEINNIEKVDKKKD